MRTRHLEKGMEMVQKISFTLLPIEDILKSSIMDTMVSCVQDWYTSKKLTLDITSSCTVLNEENDCEVIWISKVDEEEEISFEFLASLILQGKGHLLQVMFTHLQRIHVKQSTISSLSGDVSLHNTHSVEIGELCTQEQDVTQKGEASFHLQNLQRSLESSFCQSFVFQLQSEK